MKSFESLREEIGFVNGTDLYTDAEKEQILNTSKASLDSLRMFIKNEIWLKALVDEIGLMPLAQGNIDTSNNILTIRCSRFPESFCYTNKAIRRENGVDDNCFNGTVYSVSIIDGKMKICRSTRNFDLNQILDSRGYVMRFEDDKPVQLDIWDKQIEFDENGQKVLDADLNYSLKYFFSRSIMIDKRIIGDGNIKRISDAKELLEEFGVNIMKSQGPFDISTSILEYMTRPEGMLLCSRKGQLSPLRYPTFDIQDVCVEYRCTRESLNKRGTYQSFHEYYDSDMHRIIGGYGYGNDITDGIYDGYGWINASNNANMEFEENCKKVAGANREGYPKR